MVKSYTVYIVQHMCPPSTRVLVVPCKCTLFTDVLIHLKSTAAFVLNAVDVRSPT